MAKEAKKVKTSSFDAHALASITPVMNAEQVEALAQDIKKNGLRVPVVMYEGRVLDGRARVAACKKAGVKVETVNLPSGTAPRSFVYSANVHRRQLEGLELARIAVAYKQESKQKLSVDEVCELFGCSNKTVGLLSKALESGDAELVKLAENPETTRTALRVALTAKGLAKVPERKSGEDDEPMVLGSDGVLRTKAEDDALLGGETGNTTTTPAATPRASEASLPAAGKGLAAAKSATHRASEACVTHVAEMTKLVDILARATAQDLEAFFKQAVQRNVWQRLKKLEAEAEAKKAISKAQDGSKKKVKA